MILNNKINIKFKLGILFLILCISTIVLGYKSVKISEQNKETLKLVHSKSQTALNLQSSIISPLYSLRELSQSLVMAPNKELRISIKQDLDYLINKLDKEFFKYKNKDKLLFSMWENYKKLLENIKEYLREDFEEGAYISVSTSNRKQFHLLVNRLLLIQSEALNNSKTAYSQAVLKVKKIRFEIVLSVIGILFLATILGWIVASNIINSIHTVQNGLKDFFAYLNNRKKKVQKIQLNTKDELHQMAVIINQNVSTIQNNIEKNEALIKNATKVLQNIRSGNLGTRLSKETNNESLNELKNMINDMIDNLELKIQEEIDKRLKQEQILIQQSKLAAMGEMIGNIAHQWRQPLAQISAILMNMKVTYDFDNFSKEYLGTKIKEANTLTNYMSQTISDFQNFFNPQGEKEEFSIEQACKDAYFIVESSLKYHGIELSFDIKQDVKVIGYKNEYAQVILNILSNAKDILLERKIENPKINIEIKGGENYAIVKIKDNAGGVSPDILDKIFEPYFTTRHKTQGTGIGLYMSKNIIERNMNGYINVRNEQDGALFTVKVANTSKKNS